MISFEDQYIISEQKLGEGGFGTVYQGIDVINQKFVACKAVSIAKLAQIPKLVELFAQEIALQQKLKSPFTVELYKVYKCQDHFYLILEFCEGGDLSQYVKKNGPLPEQKAIGFLMQILAGFRVLHQNSIIHRDLKPANILMSGNVLKIADFGAARTVDLENQAATKIGTPLFLAPEIQEDKEYGFEVDIYSLGVLLYFMLFNDYPFGGSGIQLYNNMKSEKIDFKKNGVVISSQLKDLIVRLLKYDREQRITWAQIYQHPIVSKNLKNDNISAEIILAPQASDIKMYQDPKFSNKKGSLDKKPQGGQFIPEQKQPQKVDPYVEAQKRQVIEEKKKLALEIVSAIQKYVHKKNVYGVLLVLAISFSKLQKLGINYQIPAYLVQKKLRALNQEMLQAIVQKKNIFNLSCFNIFCKTEYYTKIEDLVKGDSVQIENYMSSTQQAALQSMAKLGLNNQSLRDEINQIELSPRFNEHLIGSLMSYAEGLKKIMFQAQDKDVKLALFFNIALAYESCCIEKLFKDQNFDFEKHKVQLLQTSPDQFGKILEQKCAQIFD
ncbi:Serine/Threonine kinase domain protein (macronuclear) [Tetrahymena thermophila SB210]|uniref:Serine/Threonine kinase domain protein n=1 Tax=Tetrahymena thermophila (strain SB210) TaxID=312017 RepID=I7MAV6_TETTS|nr:Serine/Threonine kinase domain protein [Tetrahymena thermophila SB210]EAS06228.2 Serine/Threonine kinase domain protein [Tetrahymena thermophila SB210]|eukprot:XP_001026473.2 Serine/Threonine kinase domain protein [Tetrahymena thermophila SB210]